MNRREMLLGAVAMAGAAMAGKSMADEHDHMNMPGMKHEHSANPYGKLIAAAADCVAKANICMQHCITLLGEGDKSMVACAKSSSEVIAMCTALEQLAAADSKHLQQLAKVAMDVCKECEEECKKTEKHPECKACEEACVACYKECKALVG